MNKFLLLISVVLMGEVAAAASPISDREGINYEVSLMGNAGSGDFAPYYMMVNRHGILTQSDDVLFRGKLWKRFDLSRRFSYSFGADFLTGASSQTTYHRYDDAGKLVDNRQRPAAIWLQQLYAEIKFMGAFLSVGLKEQEWSLLNSELASGDYLESGNARPIPQARIGFLGFQNIPFTRGWLQIYAVIAYGKFTDGNWLENHFNRNGRLTTGALYHYKCLYFRTKPAKPFSFAVGLQVAMQYKGTEQSYSKGKLTNTVKQPFCIEDIWKMLIPSFGYSRQEFYEGNSLGCWDIVLRYRLRNGDEIRGVYESPWEDDSGIAMQNGFDGIWGVEYKCAKENSPFQGVVVEYLDFTNQSGPIHWDPGLLSVSGTTLTQSRASGSDNYYNNGHYNGWMNYGLGIGTSVFPSPIYNLDGAMTYKNNRIRGFHAGVMGTIINGVNYKILGGYKKGWGTYGRPLIEPQENTSLLVDVTWRVPKLAGLSVKGEFAFDSGTMYGKNVGGLLTVSYSGTFNIGKK